MKKLILATSLLLSLTISFAGVRRVPIEELPFKPTPDSSVYIFYVQDYDKVPERNAHVKIYDKTNGGKLISEGMNNIDGVYFSKLPLGIDYTVEIGAMDTVFVFDEKASAAPTLLDFDLRINLVTHEYKRTFNLDVFFDSGEHDLDLDDIKNLASLLSSLRENGKMKIEIAAHTDDVGKDDSNMRLSHRRAQSVKDFLVKEGVDENRILSKGYGETKPIADNSTAEGRAKNRRVEVRVITE